MSMVSTATSPLSVVFQARGGTVEPISRIVSAKDMDLNEGDRQPCMKKGVVIGDVRLRDDFAS